MTIFSRWLIVPLSVIFISLLSGGIWLFNTQQKQILHESNANIEAIAELKENIVIRRFARFELGESSGEDESQA